MKTFINKFYRMHSPYYNKLSTTQSRSLNVKECDASNMAQTLTREDFYFVLCKNKYMFIEESEDGKWDGQNRVLKHIKDEVEPNDVVSVGQTLVCDNKEDKFEFNKTSFDFGNILITDPTE